MNHKPIVRGEILPEGADLADFLASGWTREEVIALARKYVITYSENGKVLADRQPVAAPPEVMAAKNKPSKITTLEPAKEEDNVAFNRTDLGNAKRLVAKYGSDLRYCHLWKKWFIWDSQRWLKDDTGEAERCAKATILEIYRDVLNADDYENRGELSKHAFKSEAAARIKAMQTLAESEPGIPITPDQFDKDPWLLNCQNGTLNLRTGNLQPHCREDYISKLTPVYYDPNASCPLWENFLMKIMVANINLIQFLQRAIGYSLTGTISEQVVFFLYGSGANGKSTFLETIRACLGDYAQQMPSSALLVKKGEAIPNDIARLKGARFVTASEIGEGKRLSEETVKLLTGGDTISARFMHAEFFEFKASHKILIGTNHRPRIHGTDHAIWRRIREIPFAVTISEEEQDKELPKKLCAELPGILAWAVRGSLEWQKNGLGIPQEVKAATEDYRKEMDILSDFLQECCHQISGIRVNATELYNTYKDWCHRSGEHPRSQKLFGGQLTERGITKKEIDGRVYYLDIGLSAKEGDPRSGE